MSLLVLSAVLLPTTLADFHVVQETFLGRFRTVPSNKYKCEWVNQFGQITSGSLESGYFQVTGNTCGANKLDFYRRDAGHWQAYNNGGDGQVQAECYDNSNAHGIQGCGGFTIPGWQALEKLVCYSYLCN